MPSNKMTNLLNKIERRLGTKPLNLPDDLSKDVWAEEVIVNETLDTFSRYFPNSMRIMLNNCQRNREGYYLIDEYIPENVEVIGVRDIDWHAFSRDVLSLHEMYGYGTYDFMTDNYGLDDVMMLQGRADQISLFNTSIYVEYKAPNMIKLTSATGADVARNLNHFPLEIFIKHAPNLMTIPPTMMEIFEELATTDVAQFLFQNLKYYDDLQTVYANINLKINDLESWASKRDDIIQRLEDAHVSAANKYQPLLFVTG